MGLPAFAREIFVYSGWGFYFRGGLVGLNFMLWKYQAPGNHLPIESQHHYQIDYTGILCNFTTTLPWIVSKQLLGIEEIINTLKLKP